VSVVVLSKPFSYGYGVILMGKMWLFCVGLMRYFRSLHFLKTWLGRLAVQISSST